MSSTRTRPSMTRRHFDAIAQAIAGMQGANLRERFARTLVPALQQFNESFDEERFVQVATGGRRVRRRSSESFSRASRELGEGIRVSEAQVASNVVTPWYETATRPLPQEEVLHHVDEVAPGLWRFVVDFGQRRLSDTERGYIRFDLSRQRYVLSSIYLDDENTSVEEYNFPRSTEAQEVASITVVRRNGVWAFASAEGQRRLLLEEIDCLRRGSIGNENAVVLPVNHILRWVVRPITGAGYANLWGESIPLLGRPTVMYEASSPAYYYVTQRPEYIQRQIDLSFA